MARVLIADDAIVVRKVMRDKLEEAGHEVIEAGTGEEAILRFDESDPDVSFVDVNMPVLDGFAAVTAIRQRRPNAVLVLMSVYVNENRMRRATELGATLLRKPFETNELLHALAGQRQAVAVG